MRMVKIDKPKYFIKYMAIGTKITVSDAADYQKIKSHLVSVSKPFFTHDIPEDKTTKFVLSGLPDMDLVEIKHHMTLENVPFLDIKKMKTKSATQHLFIVYFAAKTMKLDTLKQTKALGNVIVKWTPYSNSRNGPTQCNTCQLYGHGSKNCNLPPRCLLCAGSHSKSNCPASKKDQFTPRCCLCNGSHQSNHVECPKRTSYITMRLETSGRYKQHQTPNRNTASHQASSNTQPQQNNVNRPNAWSSLFKNFSQPPPSSSPPPPPPAHNLSNLHQSPANTTGSSHQQHQQNNDLFTMEELINISNELINELSKCTTKIQQFQVVNQLAIKFVFGNRNAP